MKMAFLISALVFSAPLIVWSGPESESAEPGVPRIVVLPPQRVLVLEAHGDPKAVAGPAFKSLYRTFYANADKAEKRHLGAPLARWDISQLDSSKALWKGIYALPV